MQFKALLMMAVSAVAVSAQSLTLNPEQESVLLQLATALPPSVLAAAATNQASFASDVASSIAAGNTPQWYQALPTSVKSALASIYPAAAVTSAEATTTAAMTVMPSATGGYSIGTNSTGVTSVVTPTLSSTEGASSPSSTSVQGAASFNSATLGAGLAGAMAFVGMLAL